MLNGLLSDETLEAHVRVWMENGMPNYAQGDTTPYKPPDTKPMSRYRGYGKN